MSSPNPSFYDLKGETLEGKSFSFSEYKGKAVLVVNTASKCGFTPQYTQLQGLHDQYASQGLVVLGMPCNQFGAQEPGSSSEIQEFCQMRYGVQFPLLKKGDVFGVNQSPLYSFLLSQAQDRTQVAWNFEKFLVNRDGKVVARFKSNVEPKSPELISEVERVLSK